jgi:hypothetical protein
MRMIQNISLGVLTNAKVNSKAWYNRQDAVWNIENILSVHLIFKSLLSLLLEHDNQIKVIV